MGGCRHKITVSQNKSAGTPMQIFSWPAGRGHAQKADFGNELFMQVGDLERVAFCAMLQDFGLGLVDRGRLLVDRQALQQCQQLSVAAQNVASHTRDI